MARDDFGPGAGAECREVGVGAHTRGIVQRDHGDPLRIESGAYQNVAGDEGIGADAIGAPQYPALDPLARRARGFARIAQQHAEVFVVVHADDPAKPKHGAQQCQENSQPVALDHVHIAARLPQIAVESEPGGEESPPEQKLEQPVGEPQPGIALFMVNGPDLDAVLDKAREAARTGCPCILGIDLHFMAEPNQCLRHVQMDGAPDARSDMTDSHRFRS